jgi:hypothetical protein
MVHPIIELSVTVLCPALPRQGKFTAFTPLPFAGYIAFDGACPNFRCSAGFQPALSRQDGGATFNLGQYPFDLPLAKAPWHDSGVI